MEDERTFTAFAGAKQIATGDLRAVLLAMKTHVDGGGESVLLFEDQTGRQVDVNLHGTPEEMLEREAPAAPKPGPGRPRMGVVSREVSLLPRHWDWLEQQPNGISAALRRLVDEARKRAPGKERARRAREAAGRVMTVLAGDLPDFEEALRALYAVDRARFEALIRAWPDDLRGHLARVAAPSFATGEAPVE